MGKVEPQHRKKLNQKQLELLRLIYRFRFVTSDLVAQYQGKKSRAIAYPRLATLAEQGYIGRNYSPEHRLKGKFAAYYLLAPGALLNYVSKLGLPKKNLLRSPISPTQLFEALNKADNSPP